jgi:hypothetical protein
MVPEVATWISSNVNGVVNGEQGIGDCRQHQSEQISLGTDGYLLRPSRLKHFLFHGEFLELRRA